MTAAAAWRTVFDCNVYFQALISPRGPAGRCLTLALNGEIELICSVYAITELRETATDEHLRRRFGITDARIELLIENVEKVATFLDDAPAVVTITRDPEDAHYVNLAVASSSRLIVSRDRDLLSLMSQGDPDSRRVRELAPRLIIVDPVAFLSMFDQRPTPDG